MMTMLDLFSGIGGISLGAEMTGEIQTVGFCEIAEYPYKIHGRRTPEYVTGQRGEFIREFRRVSNGISAKLDGVVIPPFPPEPDIPRLTVGQVNRVERLKALGNAVVPYQIYSIFQAIVDAEKEK